MKMRNIFRATLALAALALASSAFTACSDDETYAELLQKENMNVNRFLADHRVINEIPADTVFETGEDAPYYRLDEDGNLYMQVLDAGTKGDTVEYNELIYFRFTRYNIESYMGDGQFGSSNGNDDVLNGNYSFRFDNYQTNSSYQNGVGVQMPLRYLPVDCEVNIVIKSQYGSPSEMSYVIPFLYNIRYFRPKI